MTSEIDRQISDLKRRIEALEFRVLPKPSAPVEPKTPGEIASEIALRESIEKGKMAANKRRGRLTPAQREHATY